jgi:hypothetical protein
MEEEGMLAVLTVAHSYKHNLELQLNISILLCILSFRDRMLFAGVVVQVIVVLSIGCTLQSSCQSCCKPMSLGCWDITFPSTNSR